VPMNSAWRMAATQLAPNCVGRARRIGLSYAASSLVIGGLIGWLSRPWYGVMVGAVVLAGGLYFAFAYLPSPRGFGVASSLTDHGSSPAPVRGNTDDLTSHRTFPNCEWRMLRCL
jgi:hypothetical protein